VASDALALVEGGLAPEAVGFCGDRPMLAVAIDDDPMLETLSQVARSLPCLTVGVAGLHSRGGVDFGLWSAAAVMALVPIAIVFFLLQRQFMSRSLAGALKQ